MNILLYPFRIGIMACETGDSPPFAESQFYRRLCIVGKQLGMIVYVFSPLQIDWSSGLVKAFNYISGRWNKVTCPLPDLIYDRCFYTRKEEWLQYREAITKLKQTYRIPFLGEGLAGKWEVYQVLSRKPELQPYLPETALYRGPAQLFRWLEQYTDAVLKPRNGTHGRGVVHITRLPEDRWLIRGRSLSNQIIRRCIKGHSMLRKWVNCLTNRRDYLIQRYLDLASQQEEPYDIRVMMQKNKAGRWTLSGIAVRIGQAGGLTSNLHGGGKAVDVSNFMTRQFGTQAEPIISNVKQLANTIPLSLESSFGRLAELGIDIGVDRGGRVWIIEINSKPGRSAFTIIRDASAQRRVVENPLQYARYIMDRQRGG